MGFCGEAMKYYERVLNGKVEKLIRMSDVPGITAECGDAEKIMHACLTFNGHMLMAGDAPSHIPYEGMKGFNLNVAFDDVSEAERVFNALSDGGTVTMPFQEQFWARRAGMLVDRFGTPWIVNGGLKEV